MRLLSFLLVLCVAAVSFSRTSSNGVRSDPDVLDDALVAAWTGDHARLDGLVRHGLDPDATVTGLPLLAIAASSGHVEATRMLLRHGADVERRSVDGRTPLMLAVATGGSAATMRVLLEAGADVNATDPVGYSVLMLAVSSRQPEHVRLLLDAGADATHRSSTGSDAFDWADVHPQISRMLGCRPGIVSAVPEQNGGAERTPTPTVRARTLGDPEHATE
jgi:uncharacterized protein